METSAVKTTEMYNRVAGAADTHGPMFEVKMAALLFLRAMNGRVHFKLFSNVAQAGKFDDIVFKYQSSDGHWITWFLQLKHKTSNSKVSWQALNASKGDFSLQDYYESYCEITKHMNDSNNGICLGDIKDCSFVLFTNCQHQLSKSDIENDCRNIFKLFLNFNIEQADIFRLIDWKCSPVISNRDKFLSQFIICSGMPDEVELDEYIASEIIKAGCVIDFDAIKETFVLKMKAWSLNKEKSSAVLNEGSCIFKSAVQEARAQDSLDRSCAGLYLGIDFEESCLVKLKHSIQANSYYVHIFYSHTNPKIMFNKLLQVFKGDGRPYYFLRMSDPKSNERLSTWKETGNKKRVLVLVADREQCGEGKCEDHAIFVDHIHNTFRKVVLISYEHCVYSPDDEKKENLNYQRINESSESQQITKHSRDKLLTAEVNFQGTKPISLANFNTESGDTELKLVDVILETVTYNIDSETYMLDDNTCKVGEGLIEPACYIGRTLKSSSFTLQSNPCPQHLLDIEDRVVVLVAEPGMGKSTLLQYLASKTKKKHPETWIVFVQLRDYYQYFGKGKFKPKEVFHAMVSHNVLEGILLQNSLNETGKICLAIDGYDEIHENCLENVKQLLKYLLDTKISKIWVSSRFSRKDDLLNLFKQTYPLIRSCSLESFTEDDQINFLTMYWENQIEQTDIREIIKKINSSLSKWEKEIITGIPLQCFMVGNIFKNVAVQDIKSFLGNFDIVRMYEEFLKMQFRIAYEDKNGLTVGRRPDLFDKYCEDATREHTAAAVILLTDRNTRETLRYKGLETKFEQFAEKVRGGRENNGIVDRVDNDKPNFGHRSNAEYLFGKWLAQNYENNMTFLKEYLYKKGSEVVRDFFDRILCRDSKLHAAVLTQNPAKVKEVLKSAIDVNKRDACGRTALHLAMSVSYDESRSEDDVEVVNTLLNHGAMLDIIDKVKKWRPLRYAVYMRAYHVIDSLVTRKDVKKKDLKEIGQIIKAVDKLDSVIRLGFVNIIRFLFDNGLKKTFTLKDGLQSKLFHEAAQYEQLNVMELLLEKGADMRAVDEYQRTPLHRASEQGCVKSVDFLLNNISRDVATYVNQRDSRGWTSMHWGARLREVDVLKRLMEAGGEVTFRTVRDSTTLMIAAEQGKLDVVKFIIQHLEERGVPCVAFINMQNRDGYSAVMWACDRAHVEVVEYLVQRGADLTLTNSIKRTALHLVIDPWYTDSSKYPRHLAIARVLLSVRESRMSLLKARTRSGLTAFDFARRKNYPEFEELFSNAARDDGLDLDSISTIRS